MNLSKTQTPQDVAFQESIGKHFENGSGSTLDKLRNFPRFVPRQSLSLFLAKHELFKKIVNIHGNIVECGVFQGGGLFSWAQFSAIHEPVNHGRRIIGFDTFSGFPSIGKKDVSKYDDSFKSTGSLRFDKLAELEDGIRLFDLNRPIGHIPKIECVKGDAIRTIPRFLKQNPHTVVALLYLDFDLHKPTMTAIKNFLPRMPKGAIIAFDELNQSTWPGETIAVMNTIGIPKLKIERFDFTPALSYAVIN
jgi:hypothetical protein